MQQKYICENEIRMRLFHSRTLLMCEYKRAVRFCCFVHISPSEAGELHQPVVPLCGSQPEMGHPFTFSPPPPPSPSAFCSPGIHFVTPAPSSSHPLFLIEESTSLQSVRNAVSGAYGMCHMNQCFCC